MGYTHYWKHKGITPGDWADLTRDARSIVGVASSVKIAGGMGFSKPKFDADGIWLNGTNVNDESYETFLLTHNASEFEFCKTGQRPYDVVVTAILLRAALTIPDFNVSSDGDWSDWQPARDLYVRLFGVTPNNVLR